MENNLPDNGHAEEELERVFQKGSFADMKVIGQFNLGFILCRLGQDVFIVDQHASDEKKTFENLVKSTVITKQPLICSVALNLSVVEESIVR